MSVLREVGSFTLDWLFDWLLPEDVKSGIGCLVTVLVILLLVVYLWPSKTKGLAIDVEIDRVGVDAVWINDKESSIARRLNKTNPQHVYYAIGIINGDTIKVDLTDGTINHKFDSWWYNNLRIIIETNVIKYEYYR